MKPGTVTTNYYSLLGGVQEKLSEYSLNKAQFLNLRNVDFQVPNALQKRQGSTQALMTGTSGPITSLFEHQKLRGESYIVAGSDTAMFLLASNSFTLLSSGWSNGQPTDMLTFVDRLWMANGQKYETWDGSTVRKAGAPCPLTSLEHFGFSATRGMGKTEILFATLLPFFTVGGATYIIPVVPGATSTIWSKPTQLVGHTYIFRGVYCAYSYVTGANHDIVAPCDLNIFPRNVVSPYFLPLYITSIPSPLPEYFPITLGGFTVPPGISYVNLYVALDTLGYSTGIADNGMAQMGNTFGQFPGLAPTLAPDSGFGRFQFFTQIPAANFFLDTDMAYATTFSIDSWTAILNSGNPQFSGMPFCFFDTHIPKYIEQNQNVMFMGGFSLNPSTIWFSDIGEPEFIQPNYNFEVRTNDGDRITGMKAYQNTVVVTKLNSVLKIRGSNPDDFSIKEVSGVYGCLSNKSIVQYRQRLAFLDKAGIVEYDGSKCRIISDAAEDTFKRMNSSAAREKAVGVNHIYRNQLWFGIPVDGSTVNNLTVVYDYSLDAWTFFDGFTPSSFAMIAGHLDYPTVWAGDYSGAISYFGSSFFGDNGAGISCVVSTGFDHGAENDTQIYRKFFLDVAPTSGQTGVINGRIFTNYDRSTVQATFTFYQDSFQNRRDLGLDCKAIAAELSHCSASLPFLMNGFSWTRKFLRNV